MTVDLLKYSVGGRASNFLLQILSQVGGGGCCEGPAPNFLMQILS